MNYEKKELCLKPGAAVIHDSGGYGICCGGQICYARNEQQTVILKAMEQNQRELKALIAAVGSSEPGGLQAGMAALTMAEFILDFEAYLEDEKEV